MLFNLSHYWMEAPLSCLDGNIYCWYSSCFYSNTQSHWRFTLNITFYVSSGLMGISTFLPMWFIVGIFLLRNCPGEFLSHCSSVWIEANVATCNITPVFVCSYECTRFFLMEDKIKMNLRNKDSLHVSRWSAVGLQDKSPHYYPTPEPPILLLWL